MESGSGFDTLVPYVYDALVFGDGQNGWSIDDNGMFHLFYNTWGVYRAVTCSSCCMVISFRFNRLVVFYK